MTADVAIVGGGLAGLACATALRDSGLSIALYEAERQLGGRARSWTDAHTHDPIDLGPHILLTEYRNMLGWLELLGTRDRICWQADRLLRVREAARVTDMRLHRLPPPLHLLPSFAAARGLSWRDKLSNRSVVKLAMHFDERMVPSLDALSAAQLLQRHGVSPRFTEWFWSTACMSLLNVPLEQCSAAALMRVFSQLIGIRHYQIGFANTALADLFVPAASARIEACGGRVQTGVRVESISLEGEGLHKWRLDLGGGERTQARFVVLAIAPQSVERILPAMWRTLRPFNDLGAFEPVPYISPYLWFDRKLTDEMFWARIWRASALNTDFYDLSNIRRGWSQRSSVIASNIIGSERANELSDEAIAAGTLQELRSAFPQASIATPRHVVVNRIPMAICRPAPGTESKRPPAATPLEGLYLAGDWTRTELPSSMESAVRSGFAAAEEIWRAIRQPQQLVLPKRPTEGFARWMR
jgi:15-cis-phytoene desaturase